MLTVRIKRQTLTGETPAALSHAVRAFIEAHGYGYREIGGRWPVTGGAQDGITHISYNGKVWNGERRIDL